MSPKVIIPHDQSHKKGTKVPAEKGEADPVSPPVAGGALVVAEKFGGLRRGFLNGEKRTRENSDLDEESRQRLVKPAEKKTKAEVRPADDQSSPDQSSSDLGKDME